MSVKTQAVPREVWVADRRLRIIALSVLAGALITTLWSFRFVDSVIGDNVANSILGYDAKATPISGSLVGALFAFVSGIAGTFTACNICAFSAIAPLAAEKRSVGRVLQPLLYLAGGLIAVAALYGAIGVLIGPGLPQLSTATIGPNGFPVRLLQASVIFVSIGAIFIAWGLVALRVVRNPFHSISTRYPWGQTVFMGMLIGGFLIGRPFPLFRKMFDFAVATHNPLYGSLAFVLQGLGNVLLMVVLFMLLIYGTGGRFERWLGARPGRSETVTAIALIVGGTFFVTYWGLRVPSIFGVGWWPQLPW